MNSMGYKIVEIKPSSVRNNKKFEQLSLNDKLYYAPWADDEFQSVFTDVKDRTLLNQYRSYGLWEAVSQTSNITGDILEVGTFQGGSGVLMAKRAKDVSENSEIILCDTFEGVVKASDRDARYEGGEYRQTSKKDVKKLASRLNVEVNVLEGIFPDETGSQIENKTFKLCHIDVDVYKSAKGTLEWVWPRLAEGGVVIFDDYFVTTGVADAVDEKRKKSDRVIFYNLNGQAVMVKIGD